MIHLISLFNDGSGFKIKACDRAEILIYFLSRFALTGFLVTGSFQPNLNTFRTMILMQYRCNPILEFFVNSSSHLRSLCLFADGGTGYTLL